MAAANLINTEHAKNLEKICGISGLHIPGKSKSYDKSLFKTELLQFYEIDIDSGIIEVHPPFVCNNHGRNIYLTEKKTRFPTMNQLNLHFHHKV